MRSKASRLMGVDVDDDDNDVMKDGCGNGTGRRLHIKLLEEVTRDGLNFPDNNCDAATKYGSKKYKNNNNVYAPSFNLYVICLL